MAKFPANATPNVRLFHLMAELKSTMRCNNSWMTQNFCTKFSCSLHCRSPPRIYTKFFSFFWVLSCGLAGRLAFHLPGRLVRFPGRQLLLFSLWAWFLRIADRSHPGVRFPRPLNFSFFPPPGSIPCTLSFPFFLLFPGRLAGRFGTKTIGVHVGPMCIVEQYTVV
jgi:hypothetical protein